MSDEAGVSVDALPQAEAAELLAETMALLGGRFETILESLRGPVSSYVTSGLSTYGDNTLEDIQATARSGIALAQNVQGSVLEIAATDSENADEFREGLEELDIPINF
ncbi:MULTISPECIES: hypothetical protein [Nocardiopsis]|jgi:hypothetical protein|uniref:hypothetical protein n=1 Tax=Nocardiopsis TaxID=2013 RepID=UPI00034698D4|nr:MULTISPECIES: hypothetical protein [Nocardiopsis]